MSMTVTMSEAGFVELPKAVRRHFKLKGKDRLELEVCHDGITLRPERGEVPERGVRMDPRTRQRVIASDAPPRVQRNVKLVRKGKLLVATGFPSGIDIGAAILADREDRDAQLAAPFLSPRRMTPRR